MKNYKVSMKIGTADMVAGLKPYDNTRDNDAIQDTIAAESEEEAIMLGIQYLVDGITDAIVGNGDVDDYDVDEDKHEITVYNDDHKIVEVYYDFIAEVVEK